MLIETYKCPLCDGRGLEPRRDYYRPKYGYPLRKVCVDCNNRGYITKKIKPYFTPPLSLDRREDINYSYMEY